MAPKPKAFWPLTITAGANDKINVKRTSDSVLFVATLTAGTYLSAAILAAEVQARLQAVWANTWVVSVGDTGRVTVAGATAFQLLFSTGANWATSARDVLGFGTVDTASALTATGQYQHQNGWYGDRAVGFDSRERYDRVAGGDVSHSGRMKTVLLGGLRELRSIDLTNLPATKTKISREGAALNEALEHLWRDGYARFRWWPDGSVENTSIDYRLDVSALADFNPKRLATKELYSLSWTFRRYV